MSTTDKPPNRMATVGGSPGAVSTDPVRDYLQHIGNRPLLTAGDEVDLAKRIEIGLLADERLSVRLNADVATKRELACIVRAGQKAFDTFVYANLRMVVSIATHYNGHGLPLIDLIQEGNFGLVRAVEKFDYTVGKRFSTYARGWIRQSILRGIADSGRLIRIPVHTVEKINKLKRVHHDLTGRLHRPPDPQELGDAAHCKAEAVRKLAEAEKETVSLASPIGDIDGAELGDFIEDLNDLEPVETVMLALRSDDIHRRLQTISSRDANILRLRFGLDGRYPLTLEEVGSLYGITRERVRQLETRGLHRLRCSNLHDYLI